MNTHPNRQNDRPLIISQHPKNALTQFSNTTIEGILEALNSGKERGELSDMISVLDITQAIWAEVVVRPRYMHRKLLAIVRGEPIEMRISTADAIKGRLLAIESSQEIFVPSAAQRIADVFNNIDSPTYKIATYPARRRGLLPSETGHPTNYPTNNWQLTAISAYDFTLTGLMNGVMMNWALSLRPNRYGKYESIVIDPTPVFGRIVRAIRSWLKKRAR